jgi:hypothetical protein
MLARRYVRRVAVEPAPRGYQIGVHVVLPSHHRHRPPGADAAATISRFSASGPTFRLTCALVSIIALVDTSPRRHIKTSASPEFKNPARWPTPAGNVEEAGDLPQLRPGQSAVECDLLGGDERCLRERSAAPLAVRALATEVGVVSAARPVACLAASRSIMTWARFCLTI